MNVRLSLDGMHSNTRLLFTEYCSHTQETDILSPFNTFLQEFENDIQGMMRICEFDAQSHPDPLLVKQIMQAQFNHYHDLKQDKWRDWMKHFLDAQIHVQEKMLYHLKATRDSLL